MTGTRMTSGGATDSTQALPHATEAAMELRGLNILVAEDNPTNQIVAVQMLESLGAAVTLAGDGVEALDLAGSGGFDIGLIDIEMPRLSGLDVIRQLRAGTTPAADMPLIALTAYVMVEHRAAIGAAGADGIIAKPILSIEQLATDILSMMRARRMADALSPGPARPVGPPFDPGVLASLGASLGADGLHALLLKVEQDLRDLGELALRSLDEGDPGEFARATHTLISVAGAIGATALQDRAQCLNSAVRKCERLPPGFEAPDLTTEIEAAIVFVQDRQKKQG